MIMIPVGTRQRQGTLGKEKLRNPVGGTIYANVIWPGMKWRYAAGTLSGCRNVK